MTTLCTPADGQNTCKANGPWSPLRNMRLSRAVATPRSNAWTSHTLSSTRYGTKNWRGPSESYGKKASRDSMMALPPRNMGPAGAILIQRLPKNSDMAATMNAVMAT